MGKLKTNAGDKAKFDGNKLKLVINRPLKKKRVKIQKNEIENISWGPSDSKTNKVFTAIKGEDVSWCIYVRASRGGNTKTFKLLVIRKYLIGRKLQSKDLDKAVSFMREVARSCGFAEVSGTNGELIFSRSSVRSQSEIAQMIAQMDTEGDVESGDEFFLDDEADDMDE